MRWDFKVLEKRAHDLLKVGRPQMPSAYIFKWPTEILDGGYLASKIAQCYEGMGTLLNTGTDAPSKKIPK